MTHHLRRRLLACAAIAASGLPGVLAAPAGAAPGDLDRSFGGDGTVVSDVSPGQTDRAQGVAVQADGKIVAVGAPSKLVRYNRGGSVDTSFDGDGVVDTVIDGRSVAVQPDGKLVVAGTATAPSFLGAFAVARYNPDGSLDTGFGAGGKVITEYVICDLGECSSTSAANRVVIQPDGKIVVAGDIFQEIFGSQFRHVGVARYTPGGDPDTAFGDGGKSFVTTDTGASGEGLTLQVDGKIVVATGKGGDFFLARFLGSGPSAGAPDPDFGTAGSVSTDFGGSDAATDVVVQGDRIVAVGQSATADGVDFALAGYRASDGSLDTGFGAGGKVVTDIGTQDFASAVAVQDDGKLVVAGRSGETFGASDFALTRHGPDGSLDMSFGGDGKVTTPFGPDADAAYDVAIDPADGRIVAAGSGQLGGDDDFALARYEAVSANLMLTGSDSPDPAAAGESLTYTLTVTNRGPDGARSVTLADSLSTRVRYESSSTTHGSCTPAGDGRSVSCALGELASGASATVRIVVTPTRTGTATNRASVSTTRQDTDDSDNAIAMSTTIAEARAAQPGPPDSPPAPPAVLGPVAPAPGAGGSVKESAKLEVARSRVRSGRLDVLAPISRLASGRVRVEFFAAGRRYRFSERIDSARGRIRFSRRIPAAQARLGTGILTISYGGDADTRPQRVRLRAASNRAALEMARPVVRDGRLVASGTVSRRARGVVRVQTEYVVGGRTRTLELGAPIRDGRWSLDERLSGVVREGLERREGAVQSYTLLTGYFPARIRGEMTSMQILGPR